MYSAVGRLKKPATKKELRQIIGFFSFFRDYICNFSFVAKPLTDLTNKRVPERIPFQLRKRNALNELKKLLIEAVTQPHTVINTSRPFSIFTDSSDYSVGACLTQPINGRECPVAFASCKLTATQQRWATVEKEAYAALWSEYNVTVLPKIQCLNFSKDHRRHRPLFDSSPTLLSCSELTAGESHRTLAPVDRLR